MTLARITTLSLLLLAAACATGPNSNTTGPDATGQGAALPQQTPAERRLLIAAAADQIGTPYRYGGSDRSGFDCSGLVQFAHARVGVAVPRTTAQQWRAGRPVPKEARSPGDLVFFSLGWRKQRHVAIYEGGGSFIHAPSSGKRVSRGSLDNPYWRERLVGVRSFL
jgi:cell wall-associated NlpC family hydrolase